MKLFIFSILVLSILSVFSQPHSSYTSKRPLLSPEDTSKPRIKIDTGYNKAKYIGNLINAFELPTIPRNVNDFEIENYFDISYMPGKCTCQITVMWKEELIRVVWSVGNRIDTSYIKSSNTSGYQSTQWYKNGEWLNNKKR